MTKHLIQVLVDGVEKSNFEIPGAEEEGPVEELKCLLTLVINIAGAGGATGQGSYLKGSQAMIVAKPIGANLFINWTENGIPIGSAPTSTTNLITMDKDHVVVANFKLVQEQKGKWEDQIAGAMPITNYDAQKLMYIIYNIPITQGGTYYFLADPKGVGAIHNADYLRFGITDTDQGQTMNIAYPAVYKVDLNGNELAKYTGSGWGDFGILAQGFTKDDYDKGVRFLLEIIEKGAGSGMASNIYWRAF